MKSLYIHIPFCKSKCSYCDFASYPDELHLIDQYLDALELEMQAYRNTKISTIFIGGGTPSILSADQLEKLINLIKNNFDLTHLEEFTIEANPESFTIDKIKKLDIVTRVSLGLQALDNKILKKIGRLHTFEKFCEVFANLKDKDVNVDLIVGFQDYPNFLSELEQFLAKFEFGHLSLYMLDNYPTAENQVEVYSEAVQIIKRHGFSHYEISNFAKAGKECKHNLVYWNRGEYIGLGAAACFFLNEKRYKNADKISDYFAGEKEIENLTEEQILTEKNMLDLRLLNKGIAYNKKHDFWIKEGYLTRKNDKVLLREKGIPVFNQIFVEILP